MTYPNLEVEQATELALLSAALLGEGSTPTRHRLFFSLPVTCWFVTCSLFLLLLGGCTLPGVTSSEQASPATATGSSDTTTSQVQSNDTTTAQSQPSPSDSQLLPERLWAASVIGGERWAGIYQGEQGFAVMQDGQLLELQLMNLAMGMGRFTASLTSEPMLLDFKTKAALTPFVGATLRYSDVRDVDQFNASFVGVGEPLEMDMRVEDGRLVGTLRFALKNSIGETVELSVYDLNVPVR